MIRMPQLKYIHFSAMIVLASLLSAQSAAYKTDMKKYLVQFKTAKNKTDFLKVAGNFETLAASEKKEWLPFYYAGLSQAIAAFQADKKDIDGLCNKGDKLAKTADSLSPGNSEVYVLQAMLSAARIQVDEKKRGQKYGLQTSKYANMAVKANELNPRAYLLKGRALLHTPPALGGGAKKAKPVFDNALEKFKTDTPKEFYPSWGKDEVQEELKKINDQPQK